MCFAILTSVPVLGANVMVTNSNDAGPGSLRDAIAAASSDDTISFSLSYPATITVNRTLTINTNLTISGPGALNLTISGGGVVRVFSVNPGMTVAISGVTVENGFSFYPDFGGAIYNQGLLSLTDSTLSRNSSSYGGAIFNEGTLTLSGSLVFLNIGIQYGGGIYNRGSLTLVDSTVLLNQAFFYGGGIVNVGTFTINKSAIIGNTAPDSGGLAHVAGTGVLTNSTIAFNSAESAGGVSVIGTLTIANSTFAINTASFRGGAIYNRIGPLTMKNTILADTPLGANCFLDTLILSGGHNLSDDPSCFLVGIGDMNSTPAGLNLSSQANGGPTPTIELTAISPAVDAIPVSPTNYCTGIDGGTPLATDQRGVARPQGFGCDIGAYERKGFSSFNPKLEFHGQGFALNAAFTLSADSAPIDPVTQVVQLQIGSYRVMIPAGSFHQTQGSNSGSWTYAGKIDGVKLSFQISSLGSDNYRLNATGSPVDFSGFQNPVNVAIGIGFDTGSTQTVATF